MYTLTQKMKKVIMKTWRNRYMLSWRIDVITKYMRTQIGYRTYNELQNMDVTLQSKYLKYSFFH